MLKKSTEQKFFEDKDLCLDSLEFACLLDEIQKCLHINIDSDIVCKIFEYYEGSYENYTLLELIDELTLSRIQILCSWNKKEIIRMIEEFDINIPKKYLQMQNNIWEIGEDSSSNVKYISIYDCRFEFI
jgi:acyl carrier protein